MSDNTQQKASSKDKKKLIIFGVIIVLLIVAIIVLILLLRKKDDGRGTVSSIRTVMNEDDAGNVMDEMRKEAQKGMFECQMSMDWSFNDGKAKSQDAYIANSENNAYPFFVDVYLKDTEELIYSSPVVPVGSQLTGFALDTELPAGEYKANVMYTLIEDEESQKEISRAGFVVTINVLN